MSAKLAGGVALIKVGAATEVELKERSPASGPAPRPARRRPEGIVPDGGVAIPRSRGRNLGLEGDNHDQDNAHRRRAARHRQAAALDRRQRWR